MQRARKSAWQPWKRSFLALVTRVETDKRVSDVLGTTESEHEPCRCVLELLPWLAMGPRDCENHRPSQLPRVKAQMLKKILARHVRWIRLLRNLTSPTTINLLRTGSEYLTKSLAKQAKYVKKTNDPTQIWRRPSKKRLRISTNDLYCQKLQLLTYVSAADSMGLHSLVFM